MDNFIDLKEHVAISAGRLPHWEQPGIVYFVTFRTKDSLPQSVYFAWVRERDDWLRRHGIDPRAGDWKVQLGQLPDRFQYQFQDTIQERMNWHLDAGYGQCYLRRPELAKQVADSLLYFDHDRYHMIDFVIMPNHVHVLLQALQEYGIRSLCRSWKHYSAMEINRVLGRRGKFWQRESFDRAVRNADRFEHYRRYIANNPVRANLRDDEYLLYQCAPQ